MKRLMLFIIVLILTALSGCASLGFKTTETTKEGVTIVTEVTYKRLATTSDVDARVGKSRLKMTGQKINTAFLDMISSAIKAAETYAGDNAND